MACPGSIRLSREVPVPPSTSFAREGTAAHALAERALTSEAEPSTFIGVELDGWLVTEEMAEHVTVYTDVCRDALLRSNAYWIEHRFNLAAFNPPGPMYGTADFVAYFAESKHLQVVDLKYGAGVVVEVIGNAQLRYYALGAALSVGVPVESVEIVVVQPRAHHSEGVVRSELIFMDELLAFAGELMDAARATMQPDAALNPGSHCRFCPASGVCPAQLKRAQEVARTEFSVMPEELPPAPSTLPPQVFAEMLGKLHILDDWISAMRAHAMGQLERGQDVPGFKLVAKRPSRYWIAEDATAAWLRAKSYDDDEMMATPKLKSVAQIEKLVGKKLLPEDLYEKRSSGANMVPSSDPRPALVLSPGDDFPMLTTGEE